jgi:Tfp pilus assembly protein PilN
VSDSDVEALAANVADEVTRTIHSWTRDSYARASRVVVCGGGSLLSGLPQALEKKLGATVERLEPPISDPSLPASLLACASGLISTPSHGNVPHLDLAGVDAARRELLQRRRRVSSVSAAVVAVLIAILGVWFTLERQQHQVDDLTAQLETLDPQVKAARERGHQLSTLRAWEAQRRIPLETLMELSEAIPDSAWIERLSMALDGRLRLTGRARNEEAVEQLLSALSRSRLWSTARFESIRRRQGSEGVEFVITARMGRGSS